MVGKVHISSRIHVGGHENNGNDHQLEKILIVKLSPRKSLSKNPIFLTFSCFLRFFV